MTWKELEQYNYEQLLQNALAKVSDSLDKREGSIVYDMIAPAMYELAYIIHLFVEAGQGSLIQNATGGVLDDFALRQGLRRNQATQATVKLNTFTPQGNAINVPLGSQFTSIDQEHDLIYTITSKTGEGEYLARSETFGTIGNSYLGRVNPLTTLSDVGYGEIVGVQELAIDTESDYSLRERTMKVIAEAPFGGNISDYEQKVKEITGVGAVQVFPTWNGGGTVKISIVDTDYMPVTPQRVAEVQEIVDPTKDGKGVGVAPIGHVVTIVTPPRQSIDFQLQIDPVQGVDIEQLKPQIQEVLSNYLERVRATWDKPAVGREYKITLYHSQVISEIMSVGGVSNVRQLLINGQAQDYDVPHANDNYHTPVLGTITYTEGA